MSRIRFSIWKTLVLCVAAIILAHVVTAEECQTPPAEGPAATWAENTRVTVYVDPNLPGWTDPEYQRVLKDVFSRWEWVGGSGVTFDVKPDKNLALNPPKNSIGITSHSYSHTIRHADGLHLGSARMFLNDFSANPESMRSELSHEIGHTYGLDDCRTCTPGTTVMAAGGLPAPTPCDLQAIRLNGNYFGPEFPRGEGGRRRPENCEDCGVRYCTVTMLCRCPNGDCNVREGRLVGDWECMPMGSTCQGGRGCCSSGGGVDVGSTSSPCGQWQQATNCEWGETCCFDPAEFPAIAPPPCAAYEWYDTDQRSACEAGGSRQCSPIGVYLETEDQHPQTPQLCWAPTDAPPPLVSCGSLGGDYCSQTGSCPSGYSHLGISSDCDPCCISNTPVPCQALGCPAGSCGWQTDNCGESIFCGECGPSCGEMGGDYCSQTGGCPSGYSSLGSTYDCGPCCQSLDSCGEMGGDYCSQSVGCPAGFSPLGPSFDCAACCETIPCQSTGCPAGSCGWQTDNCSDQVFCGECAPSCGEMGGDHCSQTGSCPAGYSSLGSSSDCSPCCKTAPCQSTGCPPGTCGWRTDNCGTSIFCGQCAPTCGTMGGDYCSQNTSCPGGYTNLGQSSDCTRCCKSLPSCGAMGGDYCSQTGSCPAGYTSLGRSNDCSPCCVSN